MVQERRNQLILTKNDVNTRYVGIVPALRHKVKGKLININPLSFTNMEIYKIKFKFKEDKVLPSEIGTMTEITNSSDETEIELKTVSIDPVEDINICRCGRNLFGQFLLYEINNGIELRNKENGVIVLSGTTPSDSTSIFRPTKYQELLGALITNLNTAESKKFKFRINVISGDKNSNVHLYLNSSTKICDLSTTGIQTYEYTLKNYNDTTTTTTYFTNYTEFDPQIVIDANTTVTNLKFTIELYDELIPFGSIDTDNIDPVNIVTSLKSDDLDYLNRFNGTYKSINLLSAYNITNVYCGYIDLENKNYTSTHEIVNLATLTFTVYTGNTSTTSTNNTSDSTSSTNDSTSTNNTSSFADAIANSSNYITFKASLPSPVTLDTDRTAYCTHFKTVTFDKTSNCIQVNAVSPFDQYSNYILLNIYKGLIKYTDESTDNPVTKLMEYLNNESKNSRPVKLLYETRDGYSRSLPSSISKILIKSLPTHNICNIVYSDQEELYLSYLRVNTAVFKENNSYTTVSKNRDTSNNYKVTNASYHKWQWENDYTPVEYLESTGTQWIDTGYYFGNQSRRVFTVEWTDVSSTVYGANSNGDEILFAYNTSSTNYLNDTFTYTWLANTKYNINLSTINNNLYLYINNKSIYTNSGTTNTKKEYLFGVIHTAQHSSIDNYRYWKLYSYTIYNDNIEVRNYFPCIRKIDNKPGLYDVTTNTFFINQGTGEFLYGPVITN